MSESPHPGKHTEPPRPLWILDLGRQAYQRAWELQKQLVLSRRRERIPDILLLLEHDPVFTLGRRGGTEHLLLSPEALLATGMALIQTERGGEITYHGPGQLVAYPIVRVPGQGRGVKALVQGFEEVLLRALARFGIQGGRDPKNPGVWVGGAKIGSIGLAVREGISFHGFSLNVDMDLTPFSWIRPCGHRDLSMTSISGHLGRPVPLSEVKEAVACLFPETLSYRPSAPDAAQARELRGFGLLPP